MVSEQSGQVFETLQRMQDITQLLVNATEFRKNLPEVLQLLCKYMGASSVLLFEIAPIKFKDEQLNFQRILQIPLMGKAIDHAIPTILTQRNFGAEELDNWLEMLKEAMAFVVTPPESVGNEIYGDAKIIEQITIDEDIPAIIQAMGISTSTFVLFPIYHLGVVQGLLFFMTQAEKEWPKETIVLVQTSVYIIGNLLARQYANNYKELSQLKQEVLTRTNSFSKESQQVIIPDKNNTEVIAQQFNEIIASTVPDAVFLVDLAEGEVVLASTEHFIGYDLNLVNGLMGTFLNNIHPNFKADTVDKFFHRVRSLADGEFFSHEYQVRHRDGKWVWINERVKIYNRLPDGTVRQYLSIMQDITEKKEAYLKIEKSEQRYRNFVNYSSEGIYYLNSGVPILIDLPIEEQMELFFKNAYVEECNLVQAKRYGLDAVEDILGRSLMEAEPSGSHQKNIESLKAFFLNNYQIKEVESIHYEEEGESRYFINSAVGIVENGYLLGVWGVQKDITEEKKTESALRKSEHYYSRIIQDAQMGLWEWEQDTGIMSVNNIYLEVIKTLGGNQHFHCDKFLDLIHPEDRTALQNAKSHHLSQNTSNYQMPIRVKNTQGDWHWVQIHGRLVDRNSEGESKRVLGILLDIHQLKSTETRLKKGEELLEAALSAMPDTKLHIKLDGTIRAVYNSKREQEGQDRVSAEVVGRKLDDVVSFATAQGLLFNSRRAIELGTLQTFEFLNTGEQDTQYYEARINAINEEEVIVILRNVSALKQTEKDLTEQIAQHDHNTRQLKKYIESNLQLENFAYIASHDLREPLRTMRMFGQLLKKNISHLMDERSHGHLDFIISSSERMNELIEDLLLYSRVNTDPLDLRPINTVELLSASLDQLKNKIQKQEAEVVIQSIPAEIYGSEIRLQQLFQNLIANGIKFRRPGIPIKIMIAGHENATHWVFSVEDNGIGIKGEFFEQIFVIFKKLHSPKDYEGTGIGLAIVKRIIEQHNGEVWLSSTEGEGTTIHFSLQKQL